MTIELTKNEENLIKACRFQKELLYTKHSLKDILKAFKECYELSEEECGKVLNSLIEKEVLDASVEFPNNPVYKGRNWHKREDSELIRRLKEILYSVRCPSLSDDQIQEVAECLACGDKTIVDLL